MKKIIAVSMIMMVAGMSMLTGCTTDKDVSVKDLPVAGLAGSFSVDVHNLNEVVGDADYVFVAKVEKTVDTIYRNKVTVETEKGNMEVSDPYTKYSITVVDNIKGKLKKNKEINILKAGGVTEDKKFQVVYVEDDMLPEAGKYYVMAAYAQPDGSLLVSGPSSNLELDATNESEIFSSNGYKEYKKAFDNQVETNRKRFKSSDEE